MDKLIRVVIDEEAQDEHHHTIEKTVMELLWKLGVSGVTTRKSEMGINTNNKRKIAILEDEPFNDLPLIIETVVPESLSKEINKSLKRNIVVGQVSVINGWEGENVEQSNYYVMKIFTKENNNWFAPEDYEKVLSYLQEKHVIWTTVTKGITGFGKDHVIHSQNLFSTSKNTPIVLECLVSKENVKELVDDIKSVLEEGIVFTAPVDVVINR